LLARQPEADLDADQGQSTLILAEATLESRRDDLCAQPACLKFALYRNAHSAFLPFADAAFNLVVFVHLSEMVHDAFSEHVRFVERKLSHERVRGTEKPQ
jgi:hypothetical protein